MDYPYEFLEFNERLSFRDVHGLDARLDSYRRVRALEDGLVLLRERFWGDGDQLFAFASPLVRQVRTTRLDGRTALLSSLSRPLLKGDEIEMRMVRRLHHAFKDVQEWWEFTPFVPHHRVHIAISFPLARVPDRLEVSRTPGTAQPAVARPGTHELTFAVTDPSVGSTYRSDWTW